MLGARLRVARLRPEMVTSPLLLLAGRLTTPAGTARCPRMFYDDEELARSSQIGVAVHAAIGSLAAVTRCPTTTQLQAAANRALGDFAPIEARAHKQNVASLVGSYFWHLLPPAEFLFAGTELDLGAGRVDLLWRDSDDRLLIDEIKAGSPRELSLARTTAQVTRYLDCATRLWPDQCIGVRLLSLADPHRSVLVRPNGSQAPLPRTAYVTTKD
jgi:hypothetical protein